MAIKIAFKQTLNIKLVHSATFAMLLAAPLIASTGCSTLSETKEENKKTAGVDKSKREGATKRDSIADVEYRRREASALLPFVNDSKPDVIRARGVRALARLEHASALEPLLKAAVDKSISVREQAIFGLGQFDLALRAEYKNHNALRERIESFLVERLVLEEQLKVKKSIVRALGRISRDNGIANLLLLARVKGPLQSEALYALGVLGARTNAAKQNDVTLRKTVAKTLGGGAELEVKRAAAYVAFRQKLKLEESLFASMKANADLQTRLYLARATSVLNEPKSALFFLNDKDWRVQVEALRSLSQIARAGNPTPLSIVQKTFEKALAQALNAEGMTSDVHVLNESCALVSQPFSGVDGKKARAMLSAAITKLTEKKHPSACQCAIAHDALLGKVSAIDKCEHQDDVSRAKSEIAVYKAASISSRTRVAALTKYLSNSDAGVRAKAAMALESDASPAAREVATTRLLKEEDPVVAANLLGVVKGDTNSLQVDKALRRVIERFAPAANARPENAEPLVALSHIVQTRKSMGTPALKRALADVAVPHVIDALNDSPRGERVLSRASKVELKPLSETPLGVTLRTTQGNIRMVFDRERALLTTQNFAALARDGFYDGVRFHRVIPGFVAQAGDPTGTGSGGPGYSIPCENSDLDYVRGTVGMALDGKDTGGSQFFIAHTDQPHLAGRYTVFAQVVDGLDIVDLLTEDASIIGFDFTTGVSPK